MYLFLNKYLSRYVKFNWPLGIMLVFLFGIPRFALVLHSYVVRSYGLVMLLFLLMWFVPILSLNKQGRDFIGIRKPNHYWRLGVAFLCGVLICLAIFFIFTLLYGQSIDNAFVYIAGNNAGSSISEADKSVYFWMSVIPSMLFSPIGEELLYRGVIHGSFVPRFGERLASVFDSLAFALTHIAHFGVLYVAGVWSFAVVPAVIWVVSMFIACQVFFMCKQYCNSIFGAVAAHAGFNFMMMYVIFYQIL